MNRFSLRAVLRAWLIGAALLAANAVAVAQPAYDRAAAIAADLRLGAARNVHVAAHRADWREHPENSLPAIASALALGCDIIEIDVRRTKDGRFVIIHDLTLDRTTTGKGNVADFTLAELRQLRLVDANAHATAELIPTLEEALNAVRGRAVVNLDKSFDHLAEIYAEVARLSALDFALFSVNEPRAHYETRHPGLLSRMKFMLVLNSKRADFAAIIADYLEKQPPLILQMTFAAETDPILAFVPRARAAGIRVWMNSLWPEHNAGHHDDRALTDPAGSYGWIVAQGATVIQTDRPRLLLSYLATQGLRR